MTDKTNSAHKLNGSPPHTLEARIVEALNDFNITATDLAGLITDAEQGLLDATTIADRMQEIALDPVASPDARKAAEAAEFATFVVKRLNNTLPRLQQKHQTIAAHERRIRWNQAADIVQAERDAMAAEFAEQYPALVSQLVDLFDRLRVTDANIDGINGAAPNAESRRLESFGYQPILTATKLLSLTGEPLWPPPQPPILPHQVMPVPPHPGKDWAQAISDRNRARSAEAERVSNYYAQQARAREERENAEARASRLRNGGTL